MKTSQLQSVLAHNASTITDKLLDKAIDRIKASRNILYKKAARLAASINKMAVIQKAIKKELRHQLPKE